MDIFAPLHFSGEPSVRGIEGDRVGKCECKENITVIHFNSGTHFTPGIEATRTYKSSHSLAERETASTPIYTWI